jgi:hypothetical protein
MFFRVSLPFMSFSEIMECTVGELTFLLDKHIERENEKIIFLVRNMYEVARFNVLNMYAQNPYVKEIPKLEFQWDNEKKSDLDRIASNDEFEAFLNSFIKKDNDNGN